MRNSKVILPLVGLVALTAALVFWVRMPVAPPAPRPEELRTAVPRLTAVVHNYLTFVLKPTGPVPDDQVVKAALQDRPDLRQAFGGCPLKLKYDAQNLVLLVCAPDGRQAWFEDASWTHLPLDHAWFAVKPPRPPEFTMSLPPLSTDSSEVATGAAGPSRGTTYPTTELRPTPSASERPPAEGEGR